MDKHINKNHFPSPGFNAGGFDVPDGYFNQLPENIMERISRKEKEGKKIVPLRHRIYTLSAVAAIFILLIISGLWYRHYMAFRILSDQKEMAVYSADGMDIGEQDLYEFIDTEKINISPSITGINNETIISYLLDEGIDNETIEKHL